MQSPGGINARGAGSSPLAIFGKSPVKFGSAIPEEPECSPVLLRLLKVEFRHQHAALLSTQFGKNVTALVADEAVAVEALAVFGADAI